MSDEIPDPENPGEYLFTPGRNYWHRANNENDKDSFAWDQDNPDSNDDLTNRINPADPRLVTLFFTPYDTSAGSGQETFPVVSLGSFYITGYGRLNGSGRFQGDIEDPCDDGENFGDYPYTANEPPLTQHGRRNGGRRRRLGPLPQDRRAERVYGQRHRRPLRPWRPSPLACPSWSNDDASELLTRRSPDEGDRAQEL